MYVCHAAHRESDGNLIPFSRNGYNMHKHWVRCRSSTNDEIRSPKLEAHVLCSINHYTLHVLPIIQIPLIKEQKLPDGQRAHEKMLNITNY